MATELVKVKKASVLGSMNGGDQKIIHVGYLAERLAAVIASSPEEVTRDKVVTLDEVIKFNPEGWDLDDDAITQAENARPDDSTPAPDTPTSEAEEE